MGAPWKVPCREFTAREGVERQISPKTTPKNTNFKTLAERAAEQNGRKK